MAQVNSSGLLGHIKTGIYGDINLFMRKGKLTAASATNVAVNARTPLQMARRITWSNIIATYRVMKEGLREGWENVPKGQSLYNQFISVNAKAQPYALTKTDFQAGACIVAPYLITRGSLDPIRVDTSAGVALAVTNIRLGDLVVNAFTTVGQLAKAIVENNADWQYGDKLTYFSLVQYVKEGIPKVSMSYAAITLVEGSTQVLSSEVSLRGIANVNGMLGHDKAAPIGGFCWVHSRHDADGSLLLSNQYIIANNDDMIERYTTVDARLNAAMSYGANFANLVVLEPADEHLKRAYEYFGIKFSDARGGTTVKTTDLALNGLRYGDMVRFDGDKVFKVDTALADKLILSGSNFEALDKDSLEVIVNGETITGATVVDNKLTIALPASLNGKMIDHVVLTDGMIASSIDFKA